MKVLAIIPAAEGLNTLPNRNMRVINGKPLIFYALENAKKSKYVSDIIVTSNSDEILMIVEQIGGAKCYRRSEELSGIDIPLERVINDVRNITEFNDYDYIVTMQSIAATLKASTLDRALEKCYTENIDTMISVSEKKKYFWKIQDNEPVADKKERVSKKNLEPSYMETGAFFISKPCYITDNSRIGGKKSLYVLEPDESVDVLTFGDLKQAEYILTKKKIAFYVNGNAQIGMGHIKRVLMLADEFFVKPMFFYNNNLTNLEVFGNVPYELVGVSDTNDLIHKLDEHEINMLINDVLSTTVEYMSAIRLALPNIKVVNFEDDGEGADLSDLVINALYNECSNENWKVGAEYYIAPKMFLLQQPIEIKDKVKNILITFGGADPENYTDQILDIIRDSKYSSFHFDVVIGPANHNEIHCFDIPDNITIHRNVNGLINLMRNSDIAVSSRGRTGFELAICGIPTICVAQNEREERHSYLSEKNGYHYLGYRPSSQAIDLALNELSNSPKDDRLKIQREMQKHDLKSGRKNIIELINKL